MSDSSESSGWETVTSAQSNQAEAQRQQQEAQEIIRQNHEHNRQQEEIQKANRLLGTPESQSSSSSGWF